MTGGCILVVDDEPEIRRLVKEILEDEQYQVVTAEDATTAREAYATERLDLVLLDIWMPDTDGISLLKEWSRSGTPDVPVVMMSGHGTVDTAVEARHRHAHRAGCARRDRCAHHTRQRSRHSRGTYGPPV